MNSFQRIENISMAMRMILTVMGLGVVCLLIDIIITVTILLENSLKPSQLACRKIISLEPGILG